MGDWTMHIHGHGIHHNGRPDDADSLLKEFLLRLRGAGHDLHHASITTGASQVVAVAGPASGPSSDAPPDPETGLLDAPAPGQEPVASAP